ncbi:MerR family transcriptional regulator [Spiroplasma turonicum]|uniref:HTH transcriptional regulator merR family n=1 Tax=Spiroplasma turonicum TaxID=216946 RepID=A0A0K1P5S7_9MOLU|nr:MerR family transcriptional regulator [Spiroplasma turonicum]AKU79605.1 HTH transcriptional regulator merR family [Spiroplasma turonicum]ALX70627.1 MerR family transcriptional regulator [Spiroplasma turonicum]
MKKLYLKDISKEIDLPEYVLRFYDKKGLIPFMNRDENNYRYIYYDKVSWLKTISCLKKAGMPLKEIKKYVDLALVGEQTFEERLKIILKQEKETLKQIEVLKEQLEFIQYKKEFYNKKSK